MRNKINDSVLLELFNLTKSSVVVNSLRFLIQNFIFEKNTTCLNTINDILYGGYHKSLDFLNEGSYFENFRPGTKITTGILSKHKTRESYSLSTGRHDLKSLGQITKINSLSISNGIMNAFDGNEYKEMIVPFTYTNYNLPKFNEGLQFSYRNNRLYYYDTISSLVYEFLLQTEKIYKGYGCYKYMMSNNFSLYNNDASKGYANNLIKFNKHFKISNINYFNSIFENNKSLSFLSKNNMTMNDFMLEEYEQNNSMCIDIYSGYVLFSNISIIYSIKTNNLITPELPNNTTIPMFIYTKTQSFDNVKLVNNFLVFGNISRISKLRLLFICI